MLGEGEVQRTTFDEEIYNTLDSAHPFKNGEEKDE
jgi:hypothetical protein